VCIELVKVTSFQNLCFLLFNSANISPFSQIPQIKLCYGLNRRSERPARLLLTSLGGDVEAGLSQLDGWGGVTDTFDGSSTSSSSSKCGCREGIVESSSLSSDAAVCAEATKTRGGGSWLAFAATSLSLEALLTPKALTKTKVRVSTDGDKRMAESFSSSSSSSSTVDAAARTALQRPPPRAIQELDRATLVYLSGDGDHDLCHPNNGGGDDDVENGALSWGVNDTYVIGGIVKGGAGLKTASLEKAKSLGVQCARLPLHHLLEHASACSSSSSSSSSSSASSKEVSADSSMSSNGASSAGDSAAELSAQGLRYTLTVNHVCEVLLLRAQQQTDERTLSAAIFPAGGEGATRKAAAAGWAEALQTAIPARHRREHRIRKP